MMKMWFFASTEVSLYLPVFHVNSTAGLVLVMAIFVALTATYEGFKCFRLLVSQRSGPRPNGVSICSGSHAQQTILFTFELVLGYLIMLAVMSYNVWVLVAVLAGSLTGFVLCHAVRFYAVSPETATVGAGSSRPRTAEIADGGTQQKLLPAEKLTTV